jgi:ferredoxin-fold anticodon binding domain-containing protein
MINYAIVNSEKVVTGLVDVETIDDFNGYEFPEDTTYTIRINEFEIKPTIGQLWKADTNTFE